jgi:hypothetical protein
MTETQVSQFHKTMATSMGMGTASKGRNGQKRQFNTTQNFNPNVSQDSVFGAQSPAVFNQTTGSKGSSQIPPITMHAKMPETRQEGLMSRLRAKNEKPMNQNPFLKPYSMLER